MSDRSVRENILIALFNEVPDYVPCCPDISNLVLAKMTGKPFWDIYLRKDPPLGLAQVFAVNQLGVAGFSDQGKLDPSSGYNKRFKEKILPRPSDQKRAFPSILFSLLTETYIH